VDIYLSVNIFWTLEQYKSIFGSDIILLMDSIMRISNTVLVENI